MIANVIVLIVLLAGVYGLAPGEARSAMIGSGISIFANGYAVWAAFVRPTKRPAQGGLYELYRAEFGKLVIVGVLCAIVFAAVDGIRIAGFLLGLLSGLIVTTAALVTQKTGLPVKEEMEN